MTQSIDDITTFSIKVEQEDADKRLDMLIASRFQDQFSRSSLEKLFEEKLIFLNDNPAKKRIHPKVGDRVHFILTKPAPLHIIPQKIELNILFEDAYLIVINKSSSMVVHPGAGNASETLTNALLYHCQEMDFPKEDLRPGIVHRLDKETTGVIVAAKNEHVKRALMRQFQDRLVEKKYCAITIGNPQEQTIDKPIGRSSLDRKKMQVNAKHAKNAISHIKTISVKENLAFVKIRIETGRTHQIRVHLSSINTPVLGDSVYGCLAKNKEYKVKRQLLHSHKLVFAHPITKKIMDIEAPLPKDFENFLP